MSSIIPEVVQVCPFFFLLVINLLFFRQKSSTNMYTNRKILDYICGSFISCFSWMIIRNCKYRVSLLNNVFKRKLFRKQTQFVFILVYRLFEKRKKQIRLTMSQRNQKIVSFVTSRSQNHENIRNVEKKSHKPGWFHLHRTNRKKKQVFDTQNFRNLTDKCNGA